MVFLFGYFLSVVVATYVARQFVDPYGHRQLPARRLWAEAAAYGALWPVLPLYVTGTLVFFHFYKK